MRSEILVSFSISSLLLVFTLFIYLGNLNRSQNELLKEVKIKSKFREYVKREGDKVLIFWDDLLITDYKLKDYSYFQYNSKYSIQSNKFLIIPVSGTSQYILNKGKNINSPDTKALNDYIEFRCKFIDTNIDDVKYLIKETQVNLFSSFDYGSSDSVSNCEVKLCGFYYRQFAEAFYYKEMYQRKDDRVTLDNIKRVANAMSIDGVKNPVPLINSSIAESFSLSKNYFLILDSLVFSKPRNNEFILIINDAPPPLPIYVFKIDSIRNCFNVTKDVLNPEVFNRRHLRM